MPNKLEYSMRKKHKLQRQWCMKVQVQVCFLGPSIPLGRGRTWQLHTHNIHLRSIYHCKCLHHMATIAYLYMCMAHKSLFHLQLNQQRLWFQHLMECILRCVLWGQSYTTDSSHHYKKLILFSIGLMGIYRERTCDIYRC